MTPRHRRRWRRARQVAIGVALVGLAGLALAGPPRSQAAPSAAGLADPGASAWVLRVSLDGATLLELAASSVDTTADHARAAVATLGDAGTPPAVAEPGTPTARTTPVDWTDDTGSLTIQSGYAEAESVGARWSARAGFGRSTGTGFAMAGMLFTWDQQVQLLGAVQAFNDAVTPAVDQAAGALAPVLALAGVPTPRFTPMAPAGLVDAGGGRAAGSTAEAAVAPGYAIARADAVAGAMRLFGGFVTVDAVSSQASVERGLTDHPTARSLLAGVTVAGIPVTVDSDGLAVAGGGPLRSVLTPILDVLEAGLSDAGVTIRAGADPDRGACCTATTVGVEVVFDAPQGQLVVSVGGAEASAPAPLPRTSADEPQPATGSQPDPAPVADVATDVVRPIATRAGEEAAAPDATPDTPTVRTGVLAGLGPDAARAMRLAYLILLGGGTVATALFTVAGPSRPARPTRGLP